VKLSRYKQAKLNSQNLLNITIHARTVNRKRPALRPGFRRSARVAENLTSFYTEFFPKTLQKGPFGLKAGRGGSMRPSAVIFRLDVSGSRIRNIGGLRLATLPRIYAAIAVVLIILLAGCGGSSSSTTTPNTITPTPSSLSLNLGDVASISAFVTDSKGNGVANPPAFTYSSSNTAVATVSTAGAVCAGKWDANFIVCDITGVQPGTANITVTSGTAVATVPVNTHLHVDRVTVSPSLVNCVSSSQTQQLTAKAFSNGLDITSTVGPFKWSTLSVDVGTVDSNGLVTGRTPGQTGIVASVSAVNSAAVPWTTCPVQSIQLHLTTGPDTTFALGSAGATISLAADVVDSHGVSVSPPLTWSSSQPAVATVNQSALVTAVAAGTTSISASCAVSCNIGLAGEYSNAVTGTVAGTSATTVYATGTGTTSLVPIDSGTNAAGAAITLPATPNSFLFNRSGSTAYMGGSTALMVLDAATNTVTQNTGVVGTVLAVSPDSNRVIVAGSNTLWVLGVGSGVGTETSPIASASAADFTPDSRGAYIVAGNTLYAWTPGSFRAVPLGGATNDVKFLPNGAFAYFAGGASGPAVTARAACDNSLGDSIPTVAAPTFVSPLPNAGTVLAVESPGIDVITVNSTRVGCPPPLSDGLTRVNLGVGAFTARQLIVLTDGSKAFVTSDLGQLLGLTTATSTPFAIPLANSASAFTGGATLDGTKLYVGGSDNNIHRIDVAGGSDAQQISVSFKPDLVAVRPK
jgi:Big-like domain-containing protein